MYRLVVPSLCLFLLASPPVALGQESGQDAAWEETLERVIPSVVSLRMAAPRAFDTESARTSGATGFVVDAERGILLTNRHVVQPGPVVAEAIFSHQEEVPVFPLYRDPVHDFGFYRFDPEALRFGELRALELAPEEARVGVEIRVVGNDAGEQISILTGTLARLDRDAPSYGRAGYNDFNTFYFQAGAGTSGGSSGSPVIDAEGRVLALNAGGRRNAASSYFLPLQRVVRALGLLQQGEEVARGTIGAVLVHEPYDEVRRLGVGEATEAAVRAAFPEGKGMLVVRETVPGTPAHGVLRPGDVLCTLDGEPLVGFLPLEARLDDRVGGEVTLEVERGGTRQAVTLTVADLHALTPARYLEFGGGVINPLSYQQARNQVLEPGAPFVASPGFSLGGGGVSDSAVLTGVGDQPVGTLEELEAALAAQPDGARVPVRWYYMGEPRRERVSVIQVDRRWFPMRTCHRDDATGTWPCEPSPEPPEAAPPEPATASFPEAKGRLARLLSPSLVEVRFRIPFRAEGVRGDSFVGAGLVVDAEQGLVIVDRDTVPIALGDVRITFGGAVSVPGQVRWLHPLHNVAVVSYDPAAIGETPVRAARLDPRPLARGDRTWLVQLDNKQRVQARKERVSGTPLARLPRPSPPRFSERNTALVELRGNTETQGGVLVDRRGGVRALWSSFPVWSRNGTEALFAGLPAAAFAAEVAALIRGETPVVGDLGVELETVSLVDARSRGLGEQAAGRLLAADRTRREVFAVRRVTAGAPAADLLREGDLLLSVDGVPFTDPSQWLAARREGRVSLTGLRDSAALDVELPGVSRGGLGLERALLWSGAVLHESPLAMSAQRGLDPHGVYVGFAWYGSPAQRHRLRPTYRVIEVDGVAVDSLDAFAAAVSAREDRSAVRLQCLDLNGRERSITLRLDLAYWPTTELRRDDEGWSRTLP